MSIGMHTLIFLFSVNIAFDLRILECTYVRFIWFVEVCLSRKGNGNEISSDKRKKSLRRFDYLALMAEILNCIEKANDILCPLSTGMSLQISITFEYMGGTFFSKIWPCYYLWNIIPKNGANHSSAFIVFDR